MSSVESARGPLQGGPIPRIADISPERFRAEFLRRQPVVLTFGESILPAARRWIPTYLVARFGELDVAVSENISGGRAFSRSADIASQLRHSRMTLRALVDELFGVGAAPLPTRAFQLRLGFSAYPKAMEALAPDLIYPPLFEASLNLEHSGIWFGPSGYRTPVHRDDWDGLLIQVVGSKRVHVFPPSSVPSVEQHATPIRTYSGSLSQLMAESKEIRAIPHLCAEIEPGYTLYIPPAWPHDVESVGATISALFRF